VGASVIELGLREVDEQLSHVAAKLRDRDGRELGRASSLS
jgi:hypothetical protein